MVITVVLSGFPHNVTLEELAHGLDRCLKSDEVGSFIARDITLHSRMRKRLVALDFKTGFDAMIAQDILNGHVYVGLDREYVLTAKVTKDPDYMPNASTVDHLIAPPPRVYSDAVVGYNRSRKENDRIHEELDDQIVTLQKQLVIVAKQTKLIKAKKKLKKAKKHRRRRSDSDSSESESRRKRKKKRSLSSRSSGSSSPQPSTSSRKPHETSKATRFKRAVSTSESSSPEDIGRKRRRSAEHDGSLLRSSKMARSSESSWNSPERHPSHPLPAALPPAALPPAALPPAALPPPDHRPESSKESQKTTPNNKSPTQSAEKSPKPNHTILCVKRTRWDVPSKESKTSLSQNTSTQPMPDNKRNQKKRVKMSVGNYWSSSRHRSPKPSGSRRTGRSPVWSPPRHSRRSPYRRPRPHSPLRSLHSPHRSRNSPLRSRRISPRRRSPRKHSDIFTDLYRMMKSNECAEPRSHTANSVFVDRTSVNWPPPATATVTEINEDDDDLWGQVDQLVDVVQDLEEDEVEEGADNREPSPTDNGPHINLTINVIKKKSTQEPDLEINRDKEHLNQIKAEIERVKSPEKKTKKMPLPMISSDEIKKEVVSENEKSAQKLDAEIKQGKAYIDQIKAEIEKVERPEKNNKKMPLPMISSDEIKKEVVSENEKSAQKLDAEIKQGKAYIDQIKAEIEKVERPEKKNKEVPMISTDKIKKEIVPESNITPEELRNAMPKPILKTEIKINEHDDASFVNFFKQQKIIAENPKFVIPIKRILLQMRFHTKEIEKDLEKKLFGVLRKVLRMRIKDLLQGKDYMNSRGIVELYREHYDSEQDGELVASVASSVRDGALQDFASSDEERGQEHEHAFFSYISSKKDYENSNYDKNIVKKTDEVVILEKNVELITISDSDDDECAIIQMPDDVLGDMANARGTYNKDAPRKESENGVKSPKKNLDINHTIENYPEIIDLNEDDDAEEMTQISDRIKIENVLSEEIVDNLDIRMKEERNSIDVDYDSGSIKTENDAVMSIRFKSEVNANEDANDVVGHKTKVVVGKQNSSGSDILTENIVKTEVAEPDEAVQSTEEFINPVTIIIDYSNLDSDDSINQDTNITKHKPSENLEQDKSNKVVKTEQTDPEETVDTIEKFVDLVTTVIDESNLDSDGCIKQHTEANKDLLSKEKPGQALSNKVVKTEQNESEETVESIENFVNLVTTVIDASNLDSDDSIKQHTNETKGNLSRVKQGQDTSNNVVKTEPEESLESIENFVNLVTTVIDASNLDSDDSIKQHTNETKDNLSRLKQGQDMSNNVVKTEHTDPEESLESIENFVNLVTTVIDESNLDSDDSKKEHTNEIKDKPSIVKQGQDMSNNVVKTERTDPEESLESIEKYVSLVTTVIDIN